MTVMIPAGAAWHSGFACGGVLWVLQLQMGPQRLLLPLDLIPVQPNSNEFSGQLGILPEPLVHFLELQTP